MAFLQPFQVQNYPEISTAAVESQEDLTDEVLADFVLASHATKVMKGDAISRHVAFLLILLHPYAILCTSLQAIGIHE